MIDILLINPQPVVMKDLFAENLMYANPPLGLGYLASAATVIGESMSAGRLYDKIGDVAYAKVILVTPAGTICKICKKSLVKDEEL